MNDRFRFRVWSVREKEMIYNAEIAYDGTNYPTEWQLGENNNDGWICCFGEYIDRQEDYKVMQCTGLKDKNGQLIYEGDIVESTIATRKNKPARDVVKYDNEFAGFDPMCCYDCDCGIYNPADELVVIGNIHENPELLEDK